MSYQLIKETEPTARKSYRCIWCAEKILKGEKHVHESSKYDGSFQDHRWHFWWIAVILFGSLVISLILTGIEWLFNL